MDFSVWLGCICFFCVFLCPSVLVLRSEPLLGIGLFGVSISYSFLFACAACSLGSILVVCF